MKTIYSNKLELDMKVEYMGSLDDYHKKDEQTAKMIKDYISITSFMNNIRTTEMSIYNNNKTISS
jgi:hypothetical protein